MKDIFTTVFDSLSNRGIHNCLEIANEIEVEWYAPEVPKKLSFEEIAAIIFEEVNNHIPTYTVRHFGSQRADGSPKFEVIKIDLSVIRSKSRKRELVFFRQLMMKLLYNYTRASHQTIGAYLGGRDHSTSIHGCSTIDDLCDTDRNISKTYSEIVRSVKQRLGVK